MTTMDSIVQNFAVANLRRRPIAVEVAGFVAGFDPATDSSRARRTWPT
jgi:hypothetical protein